jgi:UDP-GlcNAc:undecaprenyl-phosphate GlcNAc-1-phosphate transferase
MVTWLKIYLLITFSAIGFSMFFTHIFRIIALKTGFVDKPASQEHKAHREPIPLLGGAAICLSVLSTVIFGYVVAGSLNKSFINTEVLNALPGLNRISFRIIAIALGGIVAVLTGLYDDKFNMSAKHKLLLQFVAASIAVIWGKVEISAFISYPYLSWGITVFWIVLIMNAVNFFDNMDGLAAGTATIAFAFFSITAAMHGQYFVAALGAAFTGATLGFWFFNHSPAVIFMGDSGSLLLGYMLAVMSCMVTYYKTDSGDSPLSILIPFFILAIPLFDTAAVVIIRLKNHKHIYIGDNNHISHRFLKMGLSRKTSVFLVHLLVLTIGMSVLPLLWGDKKTTAVSLLQAITILLLISVLQYTGRKNDT